MGSFFDELTSLPTGRSFSASGENVYGRPGAGALDSPTAARAGEDPERLGQIVDMENPHPARELGAGRKARPWIYLDPRAEIPILDVEGPGVIRHIWLTVAEERLRSIILRVYWDGEADPSVCVPLGDFFCNAAGFYGEMRSPAMCVNPKNGMNCYLPMPFRKRARITLESLFRERIGGVYYTVDFTSHPVSDSSIYLHASFRMAAPLAANADFVIADGVRGAGRFAGCYLTWLQKSPGWWGEGEVKMFIDGDREHPTVCGTGTEDYFGGAWGFGDRAFSAPYSGYHCGGKAAAGRRHAMYRFHLPDPVMFHSDFKATVQALGWQDGYRFLPLEDDISAVAYWYQTEPHAPLPPLPALPEVTAVAAPAPAADDDDAAPPEQPS